MVAVSHGDIWWADLAEPSRRPVVVVQGDALNGSRISTAVCVALTSNLDWADAPGNVVLPSELTGLPRDSVANVSQIITLGRALLTERAGRISKKQLDLVFAGLDIVLGR